MSPIWNFLWLGGAIGAAGVWQWRKREQTRIALDPASWPDGLSFRQMVTYTNIYLTANGWTLLRAAERRGMSIRAQKKPNIISLFVPDKRAVNWNTFKLDETDRMRHNNTPPGVLTQEIIHDELRSWADKNGMLLIRPPDLPRLDEILADLRERREARKASAASGPETPVVEEIETQAESAPAQASEIAAAPEPQGGDRPAENTIADAPPSPPASASADNEKRKTLARLRKANSPDELTQAVQAACEQFPDQAWPLQEAHAWAARRRDWPRAIETAATLRADFPADQAGWRLGAVALARAGQAAEAEALLEQTSQLFGPLEWAMAEYARLARQAGRWQEAINRWQAYRASFPNEMKSYCEISLAWRRSGDIDAADAIMQEALARFPQEPAIYEEYAAIAQASRDWPECDRRWQMARTACPDNAKIALAHAESPARGGAEGKRNWDEALRRFEELHVAFPDLADAYSAHITMLCNAKYYDRARALARDVAARFAGDEAIALACARVEASGGGALSKEG